MQKCKGQLSLRVASWYISSDLITLDAKMKLNSSAAESKKTKLE